MGVEVELHEMVTVRLQVNIFTNSNKEVVKELTFQCPSKDSDSATKALSAVVKDWAKQLDTPEFWKMGKSWKPVATVISGSDPAA